MKDLDIQVIGDKEKVAEEMDSIFDLAMRIAKRRTTMDFYKKQEAEKPIYKPRPKLERGE